MSDVGSDRGRNTQGFLAKNAKEILWDLEFLSEVIGCQKTQMLDRTVSTVYINLSAYYAFREYFHHISSKNHNIKKPNNLKVFASKKAKWPKQDRVTYG